MQFTHELAFQIHDAAIAYAAADISIIPILADGSKRPAWYLMPRWSPQTGRYNFPWKPYTLERPTPEAIAFWFPRVPVGDLRGIAAVMGPVSLGLEVLDFDTVELFAPWASLVSHAAPSLLNSLVIVETPRPGRHVYFRSPEPGRNQVLAARLETDPESDCVFPKTTIETRGTGGYALVPPAPLTCHPTLRPYRYASPRTLVDVPTITAQDRALLIAMAVRFNQVSQRQESVTHSQPREEVRTRGLLTPAEDFARGVSWTDILTPAGWTLLSMDANGSGTWRRPGKPFGTSASTNSTGADLLYVFSSNAAPFEANAWYSKFQAFALLCHAGDRRLAARDLEMRGYGNTKLRAGRRP